MSKIHLKYDSGSPLTNNQILKYSTSSSGATESIIYDNGSSIGIGTSSPGGKLHLSGSTPFISENTNNGSGAAAIFRSSDGGFSNDQEIQLNFQQQTSDIGRIASTYFGTDFGFNFYGNNGFINTTPIMTMRGTGNVGIGSNVPTEKLFVSGNTYISAGLGVGTSPFSQGIKMGDTTPIYFGGSNSYIYNSGDSLQAHGWNKLIFQTNSNTAMYIDSAQNVGIGTSAPTNKVTVGLGSNDYLKLSGSATDSGLYIQAVAYPSIYFNNNGTLDGRIFTYGGVNYFDFDVSYFRPKAGGTGTLYMDHVNKQSTFTGTLFAKGTDTSSSGYSFRAQDSATTDTFVVKNNGNVGIGISGPTYKLHIQGDAYVNTNLGVGTYDGNYSIATNNKVKFTTAVELNESNGSRFSFGTSDIGLSLENAVSTIIKYKGNVHRFIDNNSNEIMRLNTVSNNPFIGVGTTAATATLDIMGSTGYNQFRIRTSYTPTSSGDTNGNVGDVAWDNNYVYVKTNTGWGRSALSYAF